RGNILEGSMALVMVQPVGKPFEESWVAINPDVSGSVTTEKVERRGPLHIIHNEQVEQSVVVVIKPRGAHRPVIVFDPCFGCYILESSVASISVKNIPANACDK